jgi:putative transposase
MSDNQETNKQYYPTTFAPTQHGITGMPLHFQLDKLYLKTQTGIMLKFARKINRLQVPKIYNGGYWYFVTICVNERSCIFELDNQDTFSQIVIEQLQSIEELYQGVKLDAFVLMPNHLHAIISLNNPFYNITKKSENLGSIISRFKNNSRRVIVHTVAEGLSPHGRMIEKLDYIKHPTVFTLTQHGETGSPLHTKQNPFPNNFNYHKLWHKSYYDHIIRDEMELFAIRKYIQDNPASWKLDELNPQICNTP